MGARGPRIARSNFEQQTVLTDFGLTLQCTSLGHLAAGV